MSVRPANIVPLLFSVLLMSALTTRAHSPSPEDKARFIAEGTWDQKVANLRAHEASLPPDIYETSRALHLDRHRSRLALGADAVDTIRVVVLLVHFPDFQYDSPTYNIPGGGTLNCIMAGTKPMFDSLLFSQRDTDLISNPTGSMTEWYLENSYGNYFIQGDVFGWYMMPDNYSHYVGTNDGIGGGGAELASDAVFVANQQGVDFEPYGNGSTIVPGVIIIHAGPGAEQQGAYGIWSHRGQMSPSQSADGVWMGSYTMQPEERYNEASIVHIGVFCHEWGHVLGVPDWYNTNSLTYPTSEGLGRWAVMASGSWNMGGRQPAHFVAYSKYWVGFNEMVFLTENLKNAQIPQAETSPIAYALKENPVPQQGSTEIWFVENRQKVGFDQSLPGHGLLIYHFDAMNLNNTNPDRYRLALEEADGRMDLRYDGNNGESTDPFPGWSSPKRNFHDFTVPDSRTNEGLMSEVSVLNISDSDSLMTADLNVYYAIPYLVQSGDSLTVTDNAPGGNGDGLFEQGETIELYLEVANIMKISYWPVLHLDIDNPDVEIVQNDQSMGDALDRNINNVNEEPIRLYIPDDFMSSIVTLTFTITSDEVDTGGDRSFTSTFEFDLVLGRAQILLVDDDNDYGDDYKYRQILGRLGLPFESWNKATQGSPIYPSLSQYAFVFWFTGSYWPPTIPGGTLTPGDVTFMKELLDNGGNLLLASPSAPLQLQTLDSAFMANYLHANLTGSQEKRWFLGQTDNPVGDDLLYTTRGEVIWNGVTPTLAPVNGGQSAFTLTHFGDGDYGSCGVTYDGTYRTAFLSFAIEFLQENQQAGGYAPPDSLIIRALSFFMRGAATGVEDDFNENLLPTEFALDQNYPNPFNPVTTIAYSIATGQVEHTNLSIFNVLGQKVATLVDEIQGPGNYTVTWQGRDTGGARVASGIYFYRLIQGDISQTKKMVLLK